MTKYMEFCQRLVKAAGELSTARAAHVQLKACVIDARERLELAEKKLRGVQTSYMFVLFDMDKNEQEKLDKEIEESIIQEIDPVINFRLHSEPGIKTQVMKP
ncbi:hypothetical protein LCGC14_2779190 [marine sediment metagenome]|uniref:Uncharacterized protein n=1 Tax=marine sediment metagenome TaxID=412755 RepID=A0A0F8ZFV3_9ZZZZ